MTERRRTASKSDPIEEAAGSVTGPAVVSPAFRKRQEEKYRKKDPKSCENVSKHLAALEDSQKFPFLLPKYKELYDEFRNLQQSNDRLEKENINMRKEVGACQTDMAKCILQRSRMEGICRGLQQQNRELKEKNKEDDEHRKKTANEFKAEMNVIGSKVEEHKKANELLLKDNKVMQEKLGELYTEFKQKELELGKRNDQLDLERERAQAIQKKLELELRMQKEIHSREMAVLKHNLQKSENSCNVLLDTVGRLQEHTDVYRSQYEGFEKTISDSAQIVQKYKQELQNVTQQFNTLQEEALSWKSKYFDTMRALIEMTELKTKQDMYLQSLDKKNEQLQKLCRQLQKERSSYLKSLKEHGIEPTLIEPPEDQEKKKIDTTQMTSKEKELQLLKENLKATQEELTRMSVRETNNIEVNQTDVTTPSKHTDNSNNTHLKNPVVLETQTEVPETKTDIPESNAKIPETDGEVPDTSAELIASLDAEQTKTESFASQKFENEVAVLQSISSQEVVLTDDGVGKEVESQEQLSETNSNTEAK